MSTTIVLRICKWGRKGTERGKNSFQIKDNQKATFRYCVIQEGFSKEVTRPVNQNQRRRECSREDLHESRSYVRKVPGVSEDQKEDQIRVVAVFEQGGERCCPKESVYSWYKRLLPRSLARRFLRAWLSHLDSQRACCGHQAGFSSLGHPSGVW